MYRQKYSCAEIARALGKSRTTVAREVRRNKTEVGAWTYYSASHATTHAKTRREGAKYAARVIENDLMLTDYVREKLREGSSPEQIVGGLRLTGSQWRLCWRTIYAWAHRDWPRRKTLLPTKGAPRRERDETALFEPKLHTRNIAERSRAANDRSEHGHWEIDVMHGTMDDSAHCLLVCVERASRFAVIWKLRSLKAAYVCGLIVLALRSFDVRSITTDNGSEFAHVLVVKKGLKCDMYRSDPHHPEQRGTVENTIGRLRRDYPKGRSLLRVTQADAMALARKHNNIRRKVLKFQSPRKVLARLMGVSDFNEILQQRY